MAAENDRGNRQSAPGPPKGGPGEAAGPTIVGVRPPGRCGDAGALSASLEAVLRKAAADSRFRADLLARRSGAVAAAGIALTPEERALIEDVPADQLEAILAFGSQRLVSVPTGKRAPGRGVNVLTGPSSLLSTGIRPVPAGIRPGGFLLFGPPALGWGRIVWILCLIALAGLIPWWLVRWLISR
jgi:hypothetical protein